MRVAALSKYGFKLGSLKNDWVKCDKSLLNRDCFINLKRGDDITIISKNTGGFVTEFKVNVLPDVKPLIEIEPTQRNILKSQCLNIAFGDTPSYVLEFVDERSKRIRLAQKLFVELLQAKYNEW